MGRRDIIRRRELARRTVEIGDAWRARRVVKRNRSRCADASSDAILLEGNLSVAVPGPPAGLHEDRKQRLGGGAQRINGRRVVVQTEEEGRT
jgi:hypothetical protein